MAEQLSGIIPPRTPFDREGGDNLPAQRLQSLVPARAAAE